MKEVLVESRKEEDFVPLERTSDGSSDLLLAIVWLEREKRISSAKRAVAQVIERSAVQMIGPGFGDDVDDCAAGASLFSTVSVGRDSKLLHDFGGELIGRAITSAGLREKSVVEIEAVDQSAVLESANAPKREVAIGGGSEAPRVLSDS